MFLIKYLFIFFILVTSINGATINGTTYKINKIEYTINETSYTQTTSGIAPTVIERSTPVYIKTVTLDNGTVLNNFATNNISVILHQDYLDLPSLKNGVIFNGSKLSATNEHATQALNTTNIKDYVTNDEESHEKRVMDIKYNGYHITGSDYIFFHERYGNNSFKICALNKDGEPIGDTLIFPATRDTENGWDPGFEIGGPIGAYQHPYMGVIKASQFGVEEIYGLRQWAIGADLKFYAISTKTFYSEDNETDEDPELIAEYRFDECPETITEEIADHSPFRHRHRVRNGFTTHGSIFQINRSGEFHREQQQYTEGEDGMDDIFGEESHEFTITTWVHPTSLTDEKTNHNTANTIFAKASDSKNDNIEIGINSNGTLHLYLDTKSKDKYADFGEAGDITENNWHFIGVSYKDGEVTVQIDDKTYTDTTTWSGATNLDQAVGSPVTIGASLHVDNYFDGYMDEFKIFRNRTTATVMNQFRERERNRRNWDDTQREAVVCADILPHLSINDVTQAEGDDGDTIFNFTVTATKAFGTLPITGSIFYYKVVDGDANIITPPHEVALSSDNDYKPESAIGMALSLFSDGLSINLPITVHADRKIEKDEEFYVEIYSPELSFNGQPSFVIDKNIGIGTILNDDKEEEEKIDLDQDNDGILDSIEYGTCSTGVETLMSFDDFGQGDRTTTPYTTYCYEDGDGYSNCQNEKGIQYWPGNVNVNDGEYTIVQHPNPDASSFSTWSKEGDHTGNENGRMMVVNASLQPDEFYRRTYTVVPNAGMTVDLWILNIVKEGSNIIRPDISFKLEDMEGNQIGEMVTTGGIPENGIWNHYTLSINPENNSKIQVVLANNAPGGSGNDLALDDIRIQQIFCDTDADGIADYLDLDSDNDGIADNVEAQKTQEYIKPTKSFNENGIDNAYPNGLTPVDTDGDKIPDYLDLDSDNDGLFDIIESGIGNNDSDNDGQTNAQIGENGLDNTIEEADDYNDTNGLAFDHDIFILQDSDSDMLLNGSNALPMKRDFDYRDNAPISSLSIQDIQTFEGNEESKTITFMVTFDRVPDRTIRFDYKIINGDNVESKFNAEYSSDYISSQTEGSVIIDDFSRSYPINVTIIGDTQTEEDEQFKIIISNVEGATVSKAVAIGTILNDDAPTIRIERINSHLIADVSSDARKAFYTQIAGKDFDYSLIAYNGTAPYNLSDITLKVELLDYNSTKENDVIYNQYIYINEAQSRWDQKIVDDLNIGRATRAAAFRLSYLLDENGTLIHGNYSNESDYNSKKSLDGNNEKINSFDTFAIRPATYHISIEDFNETNQLISYISNNLPTQTLNLAAGHNYRLKAEALMEGNFTRVSNYTTNNEELNATLIFDLTSTSNCADTNISQIKGYSFIDGQLNETFIHNNVGKYTLHVEDINWTDIDKNQNILGCLVNSSSNIADSSGKFGCNIASDEGANFFDVKMTFQPYKFAFSNTKLENINGNGKDYLYMSDLDRSEEMGVNLYSTIIAQGENDTNLSNFTRGCMATDIKLSSKFTISYDPEIAEKNSTELFTLTNASGGTVTLQNRIKFTAGTNYTAASFNDLTLSRDNFLDENEGNASIDILYNIERKFNTPTNPIRVNFLSLDANATTAIAKVADRDNIPKGEGDINNGSRTFYYARVASLMKSFPETSDNILNTPLSIEIYCKSPSHRSWCDNDMNLNNIARNTHKTDSRGWYLAKDHNSTVDGKVTQLSSSDENVILENTNPVANTIDGRISNINAKYTADIEGINKSEITIDSDIWLRFNTKTSQEKSSYFVTFKSISGLTGVSVSANKNSSGFGRNLMQGTDGKLQGMIKHNGKMSW